MTMPGTFWFYSAVSFGGCVALYFVMPETEGRTLLEIEDHFSGVRNFKDRSDVTQAKATAEVDEKQNNGFVGQPEGLQIVEYIKNTNTEDKPKSLVQNENEIKTTRI